MGELTERDEDIIRASVNICSDIKSANTLMVKQAVLIIAKLP